MKTNEIKPGTEYCYKASSYSSGDRVLVLEAGIERTRPGARSGRYGLTRGQPSQAKDGVRVRLLYEKDGSPRLDDNGQPREVLAVSREIEHEWEVEVRARASRKESDDWKQQTHKNALALALLLKKIGIEGAEAHCSKVEIAPGSFAKLREIAEEIDREQQNDALLRHAAANSEGRKAD